MKTKYIYIITLVVLLFSLTYIVADLTGIVNHTTISIDPTTYIQLKGLLGKNNIQVNSSEIKCDGNICWSDLSGDLNIRWKINNSHCVDKIIDLKGNYKGCRRSGYYNTDELIDRRNIFIEKQLEIKSTQEPITPININKLTNPEVITIDGS